MIGLAQVMVKLMLFRGVTQLWSKKKTGINVPH